MGGGASKRKKLAEEEAARAERANNKQRLSEEEQLRAYKESLRKDEEAKRRASEMTARDKDGDKKGNEKEYDGDARSLTKDNESNDNSHQINKSVESMAVQKNGRRDLSPEVDPMPPVQILNPQVFENFSNEFQSSFVNDHQIGRDVPRYSDSRHRRVNKMIIHDIKTGSNGDINEQAVKSEKAFVLADHPWLVELGASFTPHSKDDSVTRPAAGADAVRSSSSSLTLSVATGIGSSTFLVDAKGKSIASIKEINKAHLDSSCLALDLSWNRFKEIHFKHLLSNLRFLNVAGNLLVSLEGIHCCKSLVGLNASNNLITTLFPLKYLLSLETLIISSNQLCQLIDNDDLSVEREKMNPEINKLMNESKKVKKRGWKPLPPKLKHLDVSRNPGLTSLHGIEGVGHLTSLDCSSCSVTKLEEGLGQLKKLTKLSVRNNKIDLLSDITTVFPSMSSLTSIDFSGNEFIAKDEKDGKGEYYMAMLELSQGRLKMLDDRKVFDNDYKRYDALKSEIQCEEIVANLNVECNENMQKMKSLLDNLTSRHRLEEEVLRDAIRGATITEEKKCKEYTSFVNEKLRELKIKENVSPAAVIDIQRDIAGMKEGAPQYVQQQPPQQQDDVPQSTTEPVQGGLL